MFSEKLFAAISPTVLHFAAVLLMYTHKNYPAPYVIIYSYTYSLPNLTGAILQRKGFVRLYTCKGTLSCWKMVEINTGPARFHSALKPSSSKKASLYISGLEVLLNTRHSNQTLYRYLSLFFNMYFAKPTDERIKT